MDNTSHEIIFIALVAVVALILAGIALVEKAKQGKSEKNVAPDSTFIKLPPQHVGMTRFEQVLQNFLAGNYQGDTLLKVITDICGSEHRFSVKDDLSILKRPLRTDGWTVAHEFANRGYVFDVEVLRAIGNPADIYGTTVAHVMISLGHRFSPSEVIALGNPGVKDGNTLAVEMAEQGIAFTFDEIVRLHNPPDLWGGTLAHRAAFNGQKFTVEQILALGDASTVEGVNLSLLMARNGYPFLVDEILRLNNPADKFGATIGHWMARWGHRFRVEEIARLGNPRISYASDDLLEYNIYDDQFHELEEDFEYQRKANLLHNGATIAHIMAREGHRFMREEIRALGDPKDAAGRTITDWMASSHLQEHS